MSILTIIGISVLVGIILIGIVRVIFYHKEGVNFFIEILLLDVMFNVVCTVIEAVLESYGDC